MNRNELYKKYIQFGDRKLSSSSKLTAKLEEVNDRMLHLDKGDLRENSTYEETVDELKSLYYKASKFNYWENQYKKFRKQIMEKVSDSKVVNPVIDVGSVVTLNCKGKVFTVLMVPEHLSNRHINAFGVDTCTGRHLLGKTTGDTVVVKEKNLVYKIKEVV